MSMDYDDKDMRESLEAFEAAAASRIVDLAPPPLDSILVAFDGSNQDDLVAALAREVSQAQVSRIYCMYAYEGAEDQQLTSYLAERAGALAGEDSEAAPQVQVVLSNHAKRSFEQILAARQETGASLVVLCAPYLDDFAVLGHASVGSNLDMLAARARVPLLVAREPGHDAAQCFRNILLPVGAVHNCDVEATRWALRLVGEGGNIRFLVIINTELVETARHLGEAFVRVDEIDESTLAGLDRPETAGLIAALQKTAWERKIGCHVMVRVGEPADLVQELTENGDHLVVTACQGPSSGRGQALVRGSRNPVLLV